MRSQRVNVMYEYIFGQQTASIEQLCERFAISKSTLRRDLDELEERGLIRKVYGGVMCAATEKTRTPPYVERHTSNLPAKRRIARKAASLVADGDVLFIDSGSTLSAFIDCIVHCRNITILTNNLSVIAQAVPHPQINVIILGGELYRNAFSLSGEAAAQAITKYNISKAFMGTTGFSLEHGITNASSRESAIKQTAVAHCRQSYVLADHTKAGVVSLFTYAGFDQITALVTDKNLPEYETALAKAGCGILLADE